MAVLVPCITVPAISDVWMSTRLALEQRVGSPAYPAKPVTPPARDTETPRPACLLQPPAGWLGPQRLRN